MFSDEFMRYLINYQKPEFKEVDKNTTKTISLKKHKENRELATILLTVKR